MPGIFQEGIISVLPLAQGPPLPLALHMRVATSQQMTFNTTEILMHFLAKSWGKKLLEYSKTDSEGLQWRI